MVVQPCLCLIWSETLKTDFHRTRLLYFLTSKRLKFSLKMMLDISNQLRIPGMISRNQFVLYINGNSRRSDFTDDYVLIMDTYLRMHFIWNTNFFIYSLLFFRPSCDRCGRCRAEYFWTNGTKIPDCLDLFIGK